MISITKHKSILYFTLFLIVASILGTRVITLDLGVVLSPLRIGLFLSPFFLVVAGNDKAKVGKKSKVFRFLLFWTVYSLILIVICQDFGEFFRHFFFLITALIISYFASLYLTEEKDFEFILICFELIAILFSAIGIYEIITGDYRFISDDALGHYQNNSAVFSTLGIRVPTGSFANPNDFGFFLLFAFCISISLTHLKESQVGRWLSRIAVVLFFFMIVSTQSRAAFISLLMGLVVIVILGYHRMKRSTKILLIAGVIVSISYITSWLIANKELYEALLEIDVSSSADGSDKTRMTLISKGLDIASNYLFLGTGIGQIEYHMSRMAGMSTNGITNVHNWWVEVLVSSGFIVFFYYVKLYIEAAFNFVKKALSYHTSTRGAVYARLGASMLAVFFVGCMSSSSIFCIEWIWAMFIYWMLLPRIIK